MVNGLQWLILFHVNYCKLSQKDPKVNDSFIEVLHGEYKSIFEDGSGEMQVNHVKVHNYSGMILYYTTICQVNIAMLD